ncbi:hypothetical protein FRC16_009086 [Serendipita sp. 398]|nr:hypothetical protein FRC16_009086 [Serendipita sp. 398]
MRFALSSLLLAYPLLVSAGLFSKDSGVIMLDEKSFKTVMKEEKTSLVAFVAPWCGHCKNMSPEYSKAAKSLGPLVPFYAVDCDDSKNRQLCGEQGIKGFPTVKVSLKVTTGMYAHGSFSHFPEAARASFTITKANGKPSQWLIGLVKKSLTE